MTIQRKVGSKIIAPTPQAQSTLHRVPVQTSFIKPATQEFHAVLRAELELKLLRHDQRVRKRDFALPVGVLLTIGLAAATSQFHKTLGVSADVWIGFFVAVGLVCAYRIVALAVSYITHPPVTIEEIVADCLNIEGPQSE